MPFLLPHHFDHLLEAGCDEAGRGCLAGPVVAAAVILPKGWHHPVLNDSKQLSERVRNTLRMNIESEASQWAVGWVWPEEIDRINILNASFLAMHRAIDQLGQKPLHLLIDGNRFNPYPGIDHLCVVKGDSKYQSIAAASILAKTHRDSYMAQVHEDFPIYGWHRNKGYPTADHRAAIAAYGANLYHRKTFALLPRTADLLADQEK